ncbi:unnamed protein product [Rotaria magnacalcarata]|uniref:Uncharacterized protein n=1 Tax=Rotaria magnacalcarata TaxID=392030 RepID=A0A816NT41_9BILA|nr:unnamed protein product [Rotaria magnacalcarata]
MCDAITVYKAIDSVQLYIVNRKQTSTLQYTSLFEFHREAMPTPVQIVNEKGQQLLLLWKAKKIDEILATAYAPDASIVDGDITYKGHVEIKKLFEKPQSSEDVPIPIDTTATSDDCVVQTLKGEYQGSAVVCKITWNKINGDWKITREDWS